MTSVVWLPRRAQPLALARRLSLALALARARSARGGAHMCSDVSVQSKSKTTVVGSPAGGGAGRSGASSDGSGRTGVHASDATWSSSRAGGAASPVLSHTSRGRDPAEIMRPATMSASGDGARWRAGSRRLGHQRKSCLHAQSSGTSSCGSFLELASPETGNLRDCPTRAMDCPYHRIGRRRAAAARVAAVADAGSRAARQLIARELRFRALLLGTHQTHTVARRIFNVRGALRLVAEFAGAEQCYAGYEGLTRLIRFHAGLVEETPHEAEQRRKSERIAVHWLHMSIA